MPATGLAVVTEQLFCGMRCERFGSGGRLRFPVHAFQPSRHVSGHYLLASGGLAARSKLEGHENAY